MAHLILSIRLLRVFEYSIAESEYLLQTVLGVFEIGHVQTALVAVLNKGRLENAKHLLQNVLLAHQLLPLTIRLVQLNFERIAATCLILSHKVNEVGEQGAQRTPIIHEQIIGKHFVGKYFEHFGGVRGKVQIPHLNRRHRNQLKRLLVLLDFSAPDLPHDRLLLLLVDGNRRAVHPVARGPMLQPHIRIAWHQRIRYGYCGFVEFEHGRLVVGVCDAYERVDKITGVAFQLGSHRVVGGVVVDLGGQVAARSEMLESVEVAPARGAATARILLDQLDLPERFARRGRGGRETRRAPYEHVLLVAVVVACQVLFLLRVEQSNHVALFEIIKAFR